MNKNRIILINNILFFLFVVCGCHHDDKTYQSQKMEKLCEDYYKSLNIKQRIDALLIVAGNDTTKVLYSLAMPKQVLERLSTGKTNPTPHTFDVTAELFKKAVLSNSQYIDSLYEDMKSQIEEANKDKDELHKVNWLLNNSFNEPLQPIWEEIKKEEEK